MFWWRYLTGKARWDTNITPPEVVELVQSGQLPPGHALDLGCGTGTNAVYLAQHGWEAVGIDFVPRAIRAARRRARQAGVAERTRFLVADIARLGSLDLGGPFDLGLDIGCGHGFDVEARRQYAANLSRLVVPGGLLMLYMLRPGPEHRIGLEPEDVEAAFAPYFTLQWTSLGDDLAANSRSAWYRLRRNENG